ncbi:PAS domain S-box protein [Deferribacterales bacterium Es71-Z0220]|nr:PAS domain S-box protein [Deferrivibrio essentukiensis]
MLFSCETPSDKYRQVRDKLLAGESWNGVLINNTKDGRVFHADVYILPVLDKNRNVVNFVGIMLDITSKIELIKKKEENERLKSLVQSYRRDCTQYK